MTKEIELQEMSHVEVLFNRISHLIEQSQIVATPLPQFTNRVGTHPAAKRQHICYCLPNVFARQSLAATETARMDCRVQGKGGGWREDVIEIMMC